MKARVKNEKLYFFERIKKRSEIKSFFDGDRKKIFYTHSDMYIYTLIAKKNDLNYFRFAVSVKKNKGHAPLRNREKRYLRELFRQNKDEVPSGYDYFVLVKNVKKIPFQKRTECFLSLFCKVAL